MPGASNYAIKPTPEQSLRSNRALLPARVIAALDIMTSSKATIDAVEKELWSDSSKRSTRYDFALESYSDVHYKCIACGVGACFSAAEQKVAYETEGKYIRQRRKLCQNCFAECARRLVEQRSMMRIWKDSRSASTQDREFQEGFRSVLLSLPKYGIRVDAGNLAAVEKQLKNDV